MPDRRLILASRSPRRLSLLTDAGFDVTQIDPPFADPAEPATHAHLSAEQWAADLALHKARSLFPQSGAAWPHSSAVVLGADTIVVDSKGNWLGQPPDRDAANRILSALLGKSHRVITGVALLLTDDRGNVLTEATFADTATVHMGTLKPSEITAFLDSAGWRGKAGAYNLFERIEAGWPITFEGDPTTIVGLPMKKITPELRRMLS
jgi:septum formation protein